MRQKLVIIVFTVVVIFAWARADDILKVGDVMPDWHVPYATADTVAMEGIGSDDFKGTRYVLASFPAAWSGGCTREVCTFRDAIGEFESLDAEVLPVSTDLVFSSHEWAKHHKLNFKLLADHRRELGAALGVFMPDWGMYQRSVFVVGPDGNLEYIDYEYSVADSTDFVALKGALAKLVR